MDFGIYLRYEKTFPKMLAVAQKADELGYHSAYLNDHLQRPSNDGREDYLEAWTAMSGIGVMTKKLRIGQIVLFNSIRNPAYLAKSVSTLDNMTNGRYEFLIGSGWNEPEYKGYDLMGTGEGMPSVKERVDRLEESLKIINLMLNQEVTNYEGKFWKLEDAINMPQPIQKPMRISVGCKKPRMMKMTALHTNGINISGSNVVDIEDNIKKFEGIVEKYTYKRMKDYMISGFGTIRISNDEDRLKKMVEPLINDKMDYNKIKSDYLVGNDDDIIWKLSHLRNNGMKLFIARILVDNKNSVEALEYFKDRIYNNV